MTLRGQAWGHDGETYDGQDMRHLVASFVRSGVVGVGDFLVTEQGTPDDTLNVAGGLLVVEADGAGLFGRYLAPNVGDDTTPAFTPTGGDGRIDEVICRVTAGVPAIEIVEGTPAGTPVAPPITGDNCEWLATVTIPPTTSVIDDSMIADRRTLASTMSSPAVVECHVRRVAVQSIPANTFTDISWDTEDADLDGFLTAPSVNLTVPADRGGRYLANMGVSFAAAHASQIIAIYNPWMGDRWYTPGAGTTASIPTSLGPVHADPGNVFSGRVYQNSGGPVNITAWFWLLRLTPQ